VLVDGKEVSMPWYHVRGKVIGRSHDKHFLGITVKETDDYDYVSGWVHGSDLELDKRRVAHLKILFLR
jgi:hypothetical protein